MHDTVKPILIMTWGNPSRGDDALGPQIYDLLQTETLPDAEILTDFQLQIEHTVDMEHREHIVFVDASISASAPFEIHRIHPAQDDSYTTHAMSPQSLLSVYLKIHQQAPPPCYLLSIRGYEFELGQPLSVQAASNLAEAHTFIRQLITGNRSVDWNTLV